jgi:hypothetical protein
MTFTARALVAGFLLSSLLVPPTVAAASDRDVTPGDWRRVETLQAGTPIVVVMKTGNRVAGTFTRLEPAGVSLTATDGRDLEVPRADVSTISATGVKDRLTNGVLAGAGIGAAVAVVILSVIASGDGYLLPSAKRGAVPFLSGIGGKLGGLVDRAHDSERLLYVHKVAEGE